MRLLIKDSIAWRVILILVLLVFIYGSLSVSAEKYVQKKVLGFRDPNTNHLYRVILYNVKTMAANSTYRSALQVSRMKLNDTNLYKPLGKPENVQTIKLNPVLADFDLHCSKDFCYMVTVTSKSKQNIVLYAWQRTQFDSLTSRDSFARASAIKIFLIKDFFYIALAQEQLHLTQRNLPYDSQEPTRFIGCTILRFARGNEKNMRYHQFIKLPFSPRYVNYLVGDNTATAPLPNETRPLYNKNYYLVFSKDQDWQDFGSGQAQTFVWSALDEFFWPYRMPQGVSLKANIEPVSSGFAVNFPRPPDRQNLTSPPPDYTGATEQCFHQIQRLLSDRALRSKQLIDLGRSVWQHSSMMPNIAQQQLQTISSQVIVHGNVTVHGSIVESPQMSILGAQFHPPQIVLPPAPVVASSVLSTRVNSLSPLSIEHRIRQANDKLHHVRNKLLYAIEADLPVSTTFLFNGPIQFNGIVQAKELVLEGVANSMVHLNGVPFHQLEHELVSLVGSQDIPSQIQFHGKVSADLLEIHGLINDKYLLKDAIDITSRFPQVIEVPDSLAVNHSLEFSSLQTPEVRLANEATFNDMKLQDIITRDNRTQIIHGEKRFKRLTIDSFNLASPDVALNGVNINRIIMQAVRLDETSASRRVINGNLINFQRPIYAEKLFVNNLINHHINISLLLHDSVKVFDPNVQHITGSKYFNNNLKIENLDTRGDLNNIQVDQIFNLNSASPQGKGDQLHTGDLLIRGPVSVEGNLDVNLINGVDMTRAVRRAPRGQFSPLQIVRGHKRFIKPLRVLHNLTLPDLNELQRLQSTINVSVSYPTINNIDLKQLSSDMANQMRNPTVIYVDNLDIDGNIVIASVLNGSRTLKATFGNTTYCPLEAIRMNLLLDSAEEQLVTTPIRIGTLRARSIQVDPGALNGLSFPQDFVLRIGREVQPVFGSKSFQRLSITPSMISPQYQPGSRQVQTSIEIGPGFNINYMNFDDLQTFLHHERRNNYTGEQSFDTINVHGNVRAKRINRHNWPEDILLKGLGTVSGPPQSPYSHNRIYSPMIFTNTSFLDIENQLVLRGPIKLHGRMNGINLTEFSRGSATYGDKDLLYSGRPLRNKIFLSGLTINGELRSQGLIDGVNFDEMKQRVVTVGPRGKRINIASPKVFMSDIIAQGSILMLYLNDLPLHNYLERVRFERDGETVRVSGRKTITGALRVNKDLFIDGLINGVDYSSLRERAISLSRGTDQLQFNKTLVVEGDVYMDDLHIDKNEGILDGTKLTDLIPTNNTPPAPSQLYISKRAPVDDRSIYMLESQSPRSMMQKGDQPVIVQRPPISILYEQGRPSMARSMSMPARPTIDAQRAQSMQLRRHLIPLNFISFSAFSNLVIGFIDSPYQSLEGYQLYPVTTLHSDHLIDDLRSYVVLDQIDFSYNPVTYHLSAVASSNPMGLNSTSVRASIGGRPHELISILPIDSPNAALFLSDIDDQALFLLISQDHTVNRGNGLVCPRTKQMPEQPFKAMIDSTRVDGNVHVYLFQVLQNTSSLASSYFDLYQTLDLPEIDSFTKFYYRDSTYVIAASRATQRLFLLILRGFSGFQVVSFVDTPILDHVDVVFTLDEKPAIVIHHTDGSYKIMEAVII